MTYPCTVNELANTKSLFPLIISLKTRNDKISPSRNRSGIIKKMTQPLETPHNSSSLDTVRSLVQEDWEGVNRVIVQRLGSDVALVNQVAHHIIHGGGKRLRPLTVLLAARACGYKSTMLTRKSGQWDSQAWKSLIYNGCNAFEED